ncbi:2-succinyl-6-hydroxy-2,4-cyclohexadiene-1-carboxylate synthase [Bacillus sp. WMMC1349]|uniref:2-succinyl-6-hydroxy-2, 4-cyclohexadiene-1-carboxylate synthase n=1 Tax=Bacillus sp. WMMC1349 TaxID=2736254 RepID=UPI0015581FE6|nr:2-succinyl-6-hydroxy-2,4-cyclohexadiene-1-carboxylate synthase [Bacillus sp. WMMC1349]NPC93846.1 2-succinyl-6-hydroxy-2,4-cyclohexadiene-1-carboxylate synthase [Bacillus sp. WMMC1349]
MDILKLTLKDGISYEIEDNGGPTEQTAVFLHGFTGSAKTWDGIERYFPGIRCVKLDLLGHRRTDSPSEKKRYSTEKQCADLLDIFDRLELGNVHLVGYSMGGRLALSFAMNHPDRIARLILESSSPGLQTEAERQERRAQDQRLGERILRKGMEWFVDYWEGIPLFASQHKLETVKKEKIRNERLNQQPLGLANSLVAMGTGAQPSWWEKLAFIDYPVLLIAGSLDNKFVAINQNMKQYIPGSRLVIAEQTGHAVHVEEPEFFGRIISDFILK